MWTHRIYQLNIVTDRHNLPQSLLEMGCFVRDAVGKCDLVLVCLLGCIINYEHMISVGMICMPIHLSSPKMNNRPNSS